MARFAKQWACVVALVVAPAPIALTGCSQSVAGDAASHLPAKDGGATPPDAGAAASSADGGTADPPARAADGVFVEAFEWTWTDLAKECAAYLGPKGFAAVLVSPPSEHSILTTYPWYERYQTVGYELDKSRSGTKDEFVAMVGACNAAGVDVYVDAVINHTTSQLNGVGSNGTAYTKYAYPNLYAAADFHQPTCQIAPADYTTSALHVQTCELEELADLDTGADYVRTTLANYLISLVQMGVHGFRIDSAKHISSTDLDAIVTKVAAGTPSYPTPFYFFEVEDPGGEVVVPSDYFGVGGGSGVAALVTEFLYAGVGDRFLNNAGLTVSNLKTFGPDTWNLIPSNRAVAFLDNHDTQRATAIFYQNEPYYDLATIFMLAWPYGYPSVFSGYAFDRSSTNGQNAGPVSDGQGDTLPIYAAGSASPSCVAPDQIATAPVGSWTCEHRVPSVAGMVGFRKATAAVQSTTDWWDDGSNAIAFGRGNLGFVVINREGTALSQAFSTELAQGAYCDVVAGALESGACTGATIQVNASGSAQITVPANGAVAIHASAMLR